MPINSGKTNAILLFQRSFSNSFRQTDKYLFNALQPSIDGLLKHDLTKQEPTFVADAIKLFLQLHQIRERAVNNHLTQTAPSAPTEQTNVDLPDPSNDLDVTIHAHLNHSIASVDKETIEKQKHEVKIYFRDFRLDFSYSLQGSIKISFLCCKNNS